jgi:hypothetical protein
MSSRKLHPDPNQHGSPKERREVSGSLHVKGEVEANLPKGFIDNYEAAQKEEGDRQEKKYRLDVITLTFVIIVAGLTVWQACLNHQMAVLAANTLKTTKEQFQRDQRPYLAQTSKSSEPPQFIPRPDDQSHGQILWNWHMTNYGKTPADHVTFTQEISLDGEPFAPSFRETAPNFGPPMAPTTDVCDSVISRPIERAEFERLVKVTDGIVIRIKIDYSDLEGTRYQTGLCLTRTNFGSLTYCKKDNYVR